MNAVLPPASRPPPARKAPDQATMCRRGLCLLPAGLLLAGCEGGCARGEVPLAEVPTVLRRFNESPFGDLLQQASWRATRRVLDAMEGEYGRAQVESFALPVGADFLALRAACARQVPRWVPLAEAAAHGASDARSFGFAQGRCAFAVVSPQPRPEVFAMVPVDVLRFGVR